MPAKTHEYYDDGFLGGRKDSHPQPDLLTQNRKGLQGAAVSVRPPLFSGLQNAEYTKISAAARVKEFRRGEMLYIESDPVSQVVLLTSGIVKLTQFGIGGTEVILRLSTTGDVLGASGLFSTGLHCSTAQAFRVCRALVWDAVSFKSLVDGFPQLHKNLVRIIGGDLQELETRFREVATQRVGPRVASQLIRLLLQIGHQVDGAVEVELSREELAQMTGTTLFTVSRLLSAWETKGLVRPRREAVAVCDLESLRAVSEGTLEPVSGRDWAKPGKADGSEV